jgi:Uma2 family endonuclease
MAISTAEIVNPHCVLFDNISWDAYEKLVDSMGESQVRLTYDNGDLEIMTLSLRHERFGGWLGRLIEMLTFELDRPICSGGSTTLKRKLKKKGLEPDECYWLEHAEQMLGKKKFNPRQDPPPDLAVEINISHSSLKRLPIYAAFKIPEIWRFDGSHLRVYRLGQGKYRQVKSSPAFPFLPLDRMEEWIRQGADQDETTLLKSFVRWIRLAILPTHVSGNLDK